MVGVLVVVAIVMAVLVYGYKHPTTRVGMYMIEVSYYCIYMRTCTDNFIVIDFIMRLGVYT